MSLSVPPFWKFILGMRSCTFPTNGHVVQIGFRQISPSALPARDLGTRLHFNKLFNEMEVKRLFEKELGTE